MTQTPAQAANRLVVRKLMPATCQEVFNVWTDAEGMRYWMCPREGYTAEAVLDPRVGGSFRIVMKGPERDYARQSSGVA